MALQVLEQTDSLSRIAISGTLDMQAVCETELAFLAATAARGKNAIIDISQLDFLASLGMGMLLGGQKALRRKGVKLVLLRPQPNIALALKMAKLTELLPLAEDEDEALRILAATV